MILWDYIPHLFPKLSMCGVVSCLGYFSDLRTSAMLQPLWSTGAQLFQTITLRMGCQTRRSPVAPSLSTFHHALTVVVPMWITLVPHVWKASRDYGDGMTGISSYLPFMCLYLIWLCSAMTASAFGFIKAACFGDMPFLKLTQ